MSDGKAEREGREQSSTTDPGGFSTEDINRVARSIGDGPMGLAHHRPQPWALPSSCFDNVQEMVRRNGGRGLSAWMFHPRMRPSVGRYVVATPHAVWHNPHDGSLVDVTPHPDELHAPIIQRGGVLVLIDSGADPVFIDDGVFLSPPLRFFAIGDSPTLAEYVSQLNERAVTDFEREKQSLSK